MFHNHIAQLALFCSTEEKLKIHLHNITKNQISHRNAGEFELLTNSMTYGTGRLTAAFTRALQ